MSNDNAANLNHELKKQINTLLQKIDALKRPLNIASKKQDVAKIEIQMQQADFWSNQITAKELQKQKSYCEKIISQFETASQSIVDLQELLDLAGEDLPSLQEIKSEADKTQKLVATMELEQMLNGANDKNNAILNINVGAGGVDSQDFAQMLLRMYKRYAERSNFKVELMDLQPGEEAGIKSATILVSGDYCYGYLKAEVGVHRLVRISPFDSNARRHTSFASVWVLPEINDEIEVEIKTEDLRIDTFRAGGAGGQHVNKTESAVRITHLPTNIVVGCQSQRSQLQNKATAMKLLKAKLYDYEMKKKLQQKDKAEAAKMEASFGSQIRNYVMAPYRLVKDLRSNYEIGNVDAVLDGDIQPLIESYLLSLSNK